MLKRRTVKYLKRELGLPERPVDLGPLVGKRVVVTGANSGIGFKACEELLTLGAEVVMACRNMEKAEKARVALLESVPEGKVSIMMLDIADPKSIAAFAREIEREQLDIDGFVNNAGVFKVRGKTADGHELVFGTNFIGTYRLTQAVLPYLMSLPHEVRLINTSSVAYKVGDWMKSGDFGSYASSKMMITRYTTSLVEKLRDSNVKVFLSHPGMAATPLAAGAFGPKAARYVAPLASIFIQSPEKSALSIPYIMTKPAVARYTSSPDYVVIGHMYGPNGFMDGFGYPAHNRLRRSVYKKQEELHDYLRTL